MTYYIMIGDEKNPLVLGDLSFNIFYCEQGFYALQNIINTKNEELVSKIVIKDEKNKKYSIDSFLKVIEKKKMRFQKE